MIMITYKIAFIGFGSIAKRHIKNLYELATDREFNLSVDLIRHNTSDVENKEYIRLINKVFLGTDEIDGNYDIIFITNPTNLHYDTLVKYKNKSKHFFVEKPIFDCGDYDLDSLQLLENQIVYTACPLRYSAVIQYLKKEVLPGDVYSARIISSSYLPDWRPNTDYRQLYSADKTRGGGVSLDLIHEWDYITYLFGMPTEVINYKGKYSNLEISSDDLSIYMAKYPDKLVELHLDYLGRVPVREIELFTKDDVITADLIKSQISYKKSGQTIELTEDRDFYQRCELEHFFDIIEGKAENDNDIQQAMKILKLTEGKC